MGQSESSSSPHLAYLLPEWRDNLNDYLEEEANQDPSNLYTTLNEMDNALAVLSQNSSCLRSMLTAIPQINTYISSMIFEFITILVPVKETRIWGTCVAAVVNYTLTNLYYSIRRKHCRWYLSDCLIWSGGTIISSIGSWIVDYYIKPKGKEEATLLDTLFYIIHCLLLFAVVNCIKRLKQKCRKKKTTLRGEREPLY